MAGKWPVFVEPKSSDPEVDIVVFEKPEKKEIRNVFSATGLPYQPPASDILLNSAETRSEYQVFPELKEVLRSGFPRHYECYTGGFIDKVTIPLYLFVSVPGTDKSRNAAGFNDTIQRCFDGTFFKEKSEELAAQFKEAFIFHISLNDLQEEECPWKAIGTRMFLQFLQKDETGPRKTINDIYSRWYAPDPVSVIELLRTGHLGEKTVVLVVDDLYKIAQAQGGGNQMLGTLSSLKSLAYDGFALVCGTSEISEPIDRLPIGSLLLDLPCNQPESPSKLEESGNVEADSTFPKS